MYDGITAPAGCSEAHAEAGSCQPQLPLSGAMLACTAHTASKQNPSDPKHSPGHYLQYQHNDMPFCGGIMLMSGLPT